MSILGTIMSSILGDRGQPAPSSAAMSAGTSTSPAAPPKAKAAVVAPTPPQGKESEPPPKPAEPGHPKPQPLPAAHAKTPPSATAPQQVDVAAVLDDLANKTDDDLDWRHSIVDLMKLLKLDSSLTARKALAKELNYAGDTKDSAAMNIWLHKQVMAKLVEGGGKLPSDVKH
jgi:hypothetical protein